MLPKKLQKIVDRTAPNFSRKVYFSKKYRDSLRQDFIRLRETAVKDLENASLSKTLKDSENRLLAESFLDISTKYIRFCNTAERRQKFYNQFGEFRLFKKEGNYIFNMETLRDKIIRVGNLLFENRLPTGKNKHATLQKEIINLDGYEKVDSGEYHMKQSSFEKGYFRFWGKKDKYFINFVFDKAVNKKLIALKCKRD